MPEEYQTLVTQAALDPNTFVRLTMKGKVRGDVTTPWQKIVVRPVLIKSQRHLQFSYFDERKDITKNYQGEEAQAKLAEALAIPYSAVHLQTTVEDIQIQITKKGKAIIHRGSPTPKAEQPSLAHNRIKNLPLAPDKPDAFLQALGIMNAQGTVRPHMADKFAQINEFLKLLEGTGELERMLQRPLHILDCGCGSSYLTFATYHYLNNVRGIPANVIGIDVNEALINKSTGLSEQLHYGDLCFERSSIIDYQPEVNPDIVLALHACNTATDEALAQSIRWDAHMILSVPCCHHDLNTQLESDLFRPVLRHGILKERMADLLTDAFRALILRIMGYRTDVIEYVASEHTARNLMIRAVRTAKPGDQRFVREYQQLKTFWNVQPHLETLLGDVFGEYL